MHWYWIASCGRCGWRSHSSRHVRWLRVLALWHAMTHHPFGYTTIAAHRQGE